MERHEETDINPFSPPSGLPAAAQSRSRVGFAQIATAVALFFSMLLMATQLGGIGLFFLVLGVDGLRWIWLARVIGLLAAISVVAWFGVMLQRVSNYPRFTLLASLFAVLFLGVVALLCWLGFVAFLRLWLPFL